jgi:hypothetical protein
VTSVPHTGGEVTGPVVRVGSGWEGVVFWGQKTCVMYKKEPYTLL